MKKLKHWDEESEFYFSYYEKTFTEGKLEQLHKDLI